MEVDYFFGDYEIKTGLRHIQSSLWQLINGQGRLWFFFPMAHNPCHLLLEQDTPSLFGNVLHTSLPQMNIQKCTLYIFFLWHTAFYCCCKVFWVSFFWKGNLSSTRLHVSVAVNQTLSWRFLSLQLTVAGLTTARSPSPASWHSWNMCHPPQSYIHRDSQDEFKLVSAENKTSGNIHD